MGSDAACAYFKDIALTEFTDSSGFNYSYDPDSGNLIDKENSLYQESYAYDEENRVELITNSYSEKYHCVYQYIETTKETRESQLFYRNGALVSTNEYVYDSYGLLIKCNSWNLNILNIPSIDLDSIKSIGYTYEYETGDTAINFGACTKEIDPLGNEVVYTYDEERGILSSQYNSSTGYGYKYEYTALGELKKVVARINATSNGPEYVEYTYAASGYLTGIKTGSTNYTLSYDTFGNPTGVQAGNNTLATYEYYPHNGKTKKINYGNGFSEDYEYNSLEMLEKIWYTENGARRLAFEYTYNADGTIDVFTNYLEGKNIRYVYDNRGRLDSIREKAIGADDFSYNVIYRVNYDSENRLSSQTNIVSYASTTSGISRLLTTSYEYNTQGNLLTETIGYLSDNHKITYNYDNFNRLGSIIRDFGAFDYSTGYSYYTLNSHTSYLVDRYTSTVGNSTTNYYYEYDSNGNITSITQGGNEVTYTYDDLGQLVREQSGRVTRNYTYDNAGNIIYIQKVTESSGGSQIIYALLPPLNPPGSTVTTVNLTYSDSQWGDLLTSYDGHAITYDEIGNPLSYYNGSAYTFAWEGRRLVGATKGSTNMSFTYDDSGIRTSKTVNGVVHTYQLNGSQIVSESWGDKLLVYLYDASGAPIGMMYRTTSYEVGTFDVFWFEKNLQGDIVAVYNSTGTKVASYGYTDAWGNHGVGYYNGGETSGAQYNPFRYRGYYYDADLDMYYLQSRYYDPNTCRFINADGYVSTGQGLTGYNMYAYCGNNPVNRVDPNGDLHIKLVVLIAAVVVFAVGHFATGVNILSSKKTVEELKEQPSNSSDQENTPSHEEIINNYLSTEYGAESGINVVISDSNAQITNGSDVNFRDRMVISMLLAEEGYTSRSAISLAAEWEAHNICDYVLSGTNPRARHVDLNSNFWDNKWYTELATILCHAIGWY